MRSRLLSFPVLLLLAGCSATAADATADRSPDKAPESLQQAQALWEIKGVTNYQITVTQSCFCAPDLRQPLRVSVSDGEVIAVEGLQQPLTQRDQLDNSRLTVPGLFGFIEQSAERDPHRLEVEFDARFGFPRRIDYDGHKMIADDEFQYELTDFRAVGPD